MYPNPESANAPRRRPDMGVKVHALTITTVAGRELKMNDDAAEAMRMSKLSLSHPPAPCPCSDLVGTLASLDGDDHHAAQWGRILDRPDAMRSHYQPITDVVTGTVVGHEALLRIVDPEDGSAVNPAELFRAATHGGWHQALDQAARRSAIVNAGSWLDDALLFVNFLPSSIYNPSVCLRTTEAAARVSGISMGQLVFEVVESERITSIPHLRRIFDQYHEMGARVALDDLGADHATLSVAEALRPDVMKIDGAISRALPEAGAVGFVEDVVALGAAIGSKVLIEGVEEPQQLECAVELGVDLAQGYLLGRPVPRHARTSDEAHAGAHRS